MLSLVRKHALLALCGTAVLFVSHTANAASWSIVGGNPLGAGDFPGYSATDVSKDNVINFAPSHVIDTTGTSTTWNTGGNLNALFSGVGYSVTWFYIGSESSNQITFNTTGLSSTETDTNNSILPGNDPGPFPAFGTQGYATALTPFSFHNDSIVTPDVVNGANPNVTAAKANFLLAYATPDGFNNLLLTTNPSDFIVIAFNDNGSNDDNHDDHMIVGFIQDLGRDPPPDFTPIPAALPLFGSVLGGGLLFQRLRRRRKERAAKA